MRFRSLALLVASSLLALPALADTTYSYTGNPFTQIDDGAAYTTSDYIIGSVTFLTPLDPDTSYVDLVPTAFSFFDGVQTITDGNELPNPTFNVTTDDNGDFYSWYIDVHGVDGEIFFNHTIFSPFPGFTFDTANDTASYLGKYANNATVPGPWVTGGGLSAVPEPSSLALLGTGAFGILGAARRRFARR